MTNAEFISPPKYVKVSFDLDPVTNAIDSLYSLTRTHIHQNLNEWVTNTLAALSPEQRTTHELAMEGLGGYLYDLQCQQGWPSFGAVIDHIAAQEPVTFRDKILQLFCDAHYKGDQKKFERPKPDELLNSLEKFLNWVEFLWGDYEPDRTLLTRLHTLLHDPARFRDRLVTHLRMMWHGYLEPEWQHNLPMLEKVVEAFRKLDFSHMTAAEAIRVVTGREMPIKWYEKADQIEELVFVPSPHLGPYLVMLGNETRYKLIFGARMPRAQAASRAEPALGRSELLIRLNALTDDTRLRILELLTQEEELCAQDLIAQLELSQSSVSRHLSQLVSTGLITERRRDVAKCYSLNPARIEETLGALAAFLKKRSVIPAQDF